MAEVVVVAVIKAGEGKVDTVLEAIKEVAAETPQVHVLGAVPAGQAEKGGL